MPSSFRPGPGCLRESLDRHRRRWPCFPWSVSETRICVTSPRRRGVRDLHSETNPTLGATVPHGMVKVGMDTDSPGNVVYPTLSSCHMCSYFFQHAGYDANSSYLVTGFSQLHDDGTGGVRHFLQSLPHHHSPICNTIITQAVPLSNFKIFPSANCSSFETCPTSLDARKIPRKIRADGLYNPDSTYRDSHNSVGTPDDFATPGYFTSTLVRSCGACNFFFG